VVSTERAVVLAGGLGKRMRRESQGIELGLERERLAARGLKVLMPLAGRPFLDYVLDSLLRAGLHRVCLVVAPEAELIGERARYVAKAAGAEVRCAVQGEARGTADAVLAAQDFVGDDCFLLCNGDNLYPDEAVSGLARKEGDECWLAAFDRDGLVRGGNIAAERVKDFAVVSASPDGRLLGIVEKPADPERHVRQGRLWVGMNLYRFTPAILDSCRAIRPHPQRGELELTAAVGHLLQAGSTPFRALFCEGGVLDLTSRADVSSAERMLSGRRLCF